jgi:hypothetical protein
MAQATPASASAQPMPDAKSMSTGTPVPQAATNASTANVPTTSAPTTNAPTQAMSANTSGVGAPASNGITGEIKESAKPGTSALSEAQLAAATSGQTTAGTQATGSVTAAGTTEEVAQPRIDGEKIQKMMDSVTKELGMRDLSQLKLGGEMTLKLDQGALPNTEVKVRFEGDEMVISIDSQTADVNKFCTDNLALLQQSVSTGMKEEMKVRIEVRNQADQPNQRKDDESGGNGKGGGGGSQGGSSGNSQQQSQSQAQSSEGDSLAS